MAWSSTCPYLQAEASFANCILCVYCVIRNNHLFICHHLAQVQSIAEHLIANSNERTVFNGVEFYMPQLAHMIIHLDVDLSSVALEQFSLVVSESNKSTFFASNLVMHM